MPEVKPTKILSFSSENSAYPAENLLKVSTFCKWKCEAGRQKQASVTFQFDHPIQFNRIDIANEGSAFVQVEVSRTDSENFEVLLPSSTFMSPANSKKGVSLNRVRIFSKNELNTPIANQKWDIAKVICSQPFNSELQFGLSFIRFYRTPDAAELSPSVVMEEERESNDSEILKPGGLFKMVQKLSEENKIAIAPTILDTKSVVSSTVTQKLLRQNRSAMDALKDDTTTSPANTSASNPSVGQQSTSSSNTSATNNAIPAPTTSSDPARILNSGGSGHSRKRILDGVIVAFSGYKNPFRSELRDLCLKLGAKYRQDWTSDCTHLICAFPNTPKWNAVKGKGVITSHHWIKECDRLQKRVSWRPYRVGRAPSPVGHVSDHEDNAEASIVEAEGSDDWKPEGSEDEEEEMDTDEDASADSDTEVIDDVEDDDMKVLKQPKSSKLKAPKDKKPKAAKGGKSWEPLRRKGNRKAPEDEDTDEEIQRNISNDGNTSSFPIANKNDPLPGLPDIFSGKKFYIFSKDIVLKEEETVYRLIITFGGKVELNMNTDVEFVVSRAAWCSDFDEALEVCPSLIFVKPEWIYACDKAGKCVPYQRYQIVA
nr:DNA repair protein XRCC1 [Hymenolepis microstoma]